MSTRNNNRANISRISAVGLGVFAVAGASLGPVHAPFMQQAPAVVLAAVDPSCKAVVDASKKTLETPYHSYSTVSGAISGGPPMNIEMIFVQGSNYTKSDGKWTASIVTAQDMKDMLASKETMNTQSVCKHLRDESVSGGNAAVYSALSGAGTIDQTVWISTMKGLILRVEMDITSKGQSKSHVSIRYDYSNVQKPQM